MKFFERLMKNDNPNTGGIALFACMCLFLFIGSVGIGSFYFSGLLDAETYHMKTVEADADIISHLPTCGKQSQKKEGYVTASCKQKGASHGDTPL